MLARDVVACAMEAGVILRVEQGRLLYEATRGQLSGELRGLLARHKAELIDYLQRLQRSESAQSGAGKMPPIQPRRQRGGKWPLSFAQQRLWFLDSLAGGSVEYNMPSAFRFIGHFDLAAFRSATAAIIARHEILRTCYRLEEGEVFQAAREFVDVPLRVSDLSAASGTQQGSELQRLLQEELFKPFDLSRDVMLRAHVIVLGPTEHYVIFNIHHIASDGWSIGILFSEFSSLYGAYADGRRDPLVPLAIQYADFAQWQREWMQGEVLGHQLQYWRRQLAGLPQLHSLPLDAPRPPVQTYSGDFQRYVLDRELTRRVRDFCREANVTLFMFLETVFAVLLSRFSGQTDIVVGTPVAGRVHRDVEPLIGCFVNNLILRTAVDGAARFIDVLTRNKEAVIDAFAHQHVPFEVLVEEVNPARSRSHAPMFQIMFMLQGAAPADLSLPGLRLATPQPQKTLTKFDLELVCTDAGEEIILIWSYNVDLFQGATVSRFAAGYQLLLEAVLNTPQQACGKFPLLTAPERRELLRNWNHVPAAAREGRCLHELIEAQVARTPHQPAVSAGDVMLTYAQLNSRSNQLARYLLGSGVEPGTLIGLCLGRSEELVIALLGILKAGCCYLPLDPTYPAARIDYMIEHSGATTLIGMARSIDALTRRPERVICLDATDTRERLQSLPDSDVSPKSAVAGASSLAYVIYTSGSTGRPKGVEVEHGSVVNFLEAMRSEPGMQADDRLLAVTPISFDIHVLELYLPLIAGGTVVIAGRDDCVDGARLVDLLDSARITVMQATPATWKLMLGSGRWNGERRIKVLCGGEALDGRLAEALLPRATSLWNMYGPTETTVWSACARIAPGSPIVIGRPIRDTYIYVLSPELELQPLGGVGELYIGGVGLARGYRGRPDLTEERFIWAAVPELGRVRLYRTGDLGRWLAGGRLECGGRIDTQVKIRGFRIEIAEVQHALAQQPGVAECAVDAASDENGERLLVAYVVPADREAVEAGGRQQQLTAQIAAGLRTVLPEYMLPSGYLCLQQLPLTANGKLDRARLPAHLFDGAQHSLYEAPRNDIESQLCAIWRELLKVERVGIRDDFFMLGGHSLLATRLISRMRSEFSMEDADFPVAALFAARTVEKLAEHISAHSLAARMSRKRRELMDASSQLEEGTL